MRCNGLLGGQSVILLEARHGKLGDTGIYCIVQSTISMHSMLMLGGPVACPPQESFEKNALRLNLRQFQSPNIYIMCFNFKVQINCERIINITIMYMENIRRASCHI